MAVTRSSHLVIRPDGTYARVEAADAPGTDPAETEKLGDDFEALLESEEGPDRDQGAKPPMSGLPTPARLADQAHRDEAADAAAAAKGRAKDARPGAPGSDHRADQAMQAGAEAEVRAKEHKHKQDGEGGGQHSGGGAGADASGALMAFQTDPAAPQPGPGVPVTKGAPAPTAGPAMAEIASQVAARIAIAHGQGSAKVRIDLRQDVLPETSMTVEDQAGTVVVTVSSGSNKAAAVLSTGAEELGRAISRRTGRRTRIDFAGQSWTADAEEGDPDQSAAPDEGR